MLPRQDMTARSGAPGLERTATSSGARLLMAWKPATRLASAALPSRARDIRVASKKDPGIADVGEVGVGRRTKPMERAEKEFDMKVLLASCKAWGQVKALMAESPHSFQKDHELLCNCLLRTADLIGPLKSIKSSEERAQAKAMVDSLAAQIMREMHRLKGTSICGVVLAMRRLAYAPPKLVKCIFLYMSDRERIDPGGPSADGRRKRKALFTVAERAALLATFAQMGLRPPPETVNRALANSYSFLKFATPQDTSNLAQALCTWRAVVRPRFAGRLFQEARETMGSMDAAGLVALSYVMANSGYELSNFHASSLVNAVAPSLPSLPTPSHYPTLLLSLLRNGCAIPPDLFDTACAALMQPPPTKPTARAAAAASKKKASAGAAAGAAVKTRMQQLSAAELVVVLGVLTVQFKYLPEEDFVPQLLLCLQERCGELGPSDAAVALQLLPGVIRAEDQDAREDAADLIDELLAVMEGGMETVSAKDLKGVAEALKALQHTPDELWAAAARDQILRRASVGSDGAPSGAGRPSLVTLAGALAALPVCTDAASPTSSAALLAAIVSRGASLGGFSYFQVEELRRYISYLAAAGVPIPAAPLPEAQYGDQCLDHEHEPAAADTGAGATEDIELAVDLVSPGRPSRAVLARVLEVRTPEPVVEDGDSNGGGGVQGEDGTEAGWAPAPPPLDLLGYARADPDLPLLLAVVMHARDAANAAAVATAAGRERAAARQEPIWGGDDADMDGSWLEAGADDGSFGGSSGRAFGGGSRAFGGRGGRGASPSSNQWQDEDSWSSGEAAGIGGGGGGGGYSQFGGYARRNGGDRGYSSAGRGGGGGWGASPGYEDGASSQGADDTWGGEWDSGSGSGGGYAQGTGRRSAGFGGGYGDDSFGPNGEDYSQWDGAAGGGGGRAMQQQQQQRYRGGNQQDGGYYGDDDGNLEPGFDDEEGGPVQRGGGGQPAAPGGGDAPIIRSTRTGRGNRGAGRGRR